MTSDRVDAAVIAISMRNRELGRWADLAANVLTFGGGEDAIGQAGVQNFVWYELPRKFDEEDWVAAVTGMAVLLDELGLHRLAAIARSTTTTAVLDAWSDGSSKGFARYKAASESSGVKPPDTDLLEWGAMMGLEEARAYSLVESRLEQAIVSGKLRPGGPNWKARQRELTDAVLAEPDELNPKGSIRLVIIAERLSLWARTSRPEKLQVWRRKVLEHFADPLPDTDPEPAIRAMRWLLEACKAGVPLTQAGYLPPALVREATDRFDWWPWHGRPRSEVDVHELESLREIATRLHLVTKRAGRLTTSKEGARLLADPVELWQRLAATVGCDSEYHAMLSEMIAHRLLEGPARGDELEEAILPVVAAQGWQTDGGPALPEHHRHSIHEPLYHWRLFGMLDEVRPRWIEHKPTGEAVTSLTEIGRASAVHLLRSRAMAPRREI
jgi:hypothetical protein